MLLLPLPGGPKTNRLRPEETASPANSAASGDRTRPDNAAATCSGCTCGVCANCQRSRGNILRRLWGDEIPDPNEGRQMGIFGRSRRSLTGCNAWIHVGNASLSWPLSQDLFRALANPSGHAITVPNKRAWKGHKPLYQLLRDRALGISRPVRWISK